MHRKCDRRARTYLRKVARTLLEGLKRIDPMKRGRYSSGVLAGSLALAAGCGSSDRGSPLEVCAGGTSITRSDPVGDARNSLPPPGYARGSILRNVGAFDIRGVTVATTSTHLCVSVRFAAAMRVQKDVINRRIRVDLAPAGDRLDDLTPLAHLEFGYARDSALYGSLDSYDPEDPIAGQRTSAVTGTTVQLAVPLRWLVRTARSGIYKTRHLNPDSFFWRVRVPSDCYPGPKRLSGFPAGSSPPVSKRTDADLSHRCA